MKYILIVLFFIGCKKELKENKSIINEDVQLESQIIETENTYKISDFDVTLKQIKGKGLSYNCTSKLIVKKKKTIIDSISFKPEAVGGDYGITKPFVLKNHLLFTKHGDYDGRTLLVNNEGKIINIIGGDNYLDKENQILITIYESDISGFAVYDLSNDKIIFEMTEPPCLPVSFHKIDNRYYFKCLDFENDDTSIWEIESELERIMQVELLTSDFNDNNILINLSRDSADCICK